MYKIKVEQFEGPLDLLLQLIETQELDITQVSLAQVTDQYITYLEKAEGFNPEELADFLVVAAKLLLIKSKVLLPYLSMDEEDVGSQLENQLKIYQKFYEASKIIHKMILKKRFMYQRENIRSYEVVFCPPEGLTKDDLVGFFRIILHNLEPVIQLPQQVMKKTMSLKEKIWQIKDIISSNSEMNFRNLVNGVKSKTEIIVTFLALLELIKQRSIVVVQDQIFEEIKIQNINKQENS